MGRDWSVRITSGEYKNMGTCLNGRDGEQDDGNERASDARAE